MQKEVYEVWHVKEDVVKASRDVQGPTTVRFPRDFELAARVQARYLEEVFVRTSDPVKPWWRNRGVECLKEARSTQVGDVVVAPDQRVFQVLGRGWICVHDPALGQALEQARAAALMNVTKTQERKPLPEQTQSLEQKPKLLH